MDNPFSKLKNSKINGFRHKIIQIDNELVDKIILPREENTYKGDYGRAFFIAGSKGFTGAAFLTAQAAVRSGAGLVTLCTPKEIQDILCVKLDEAMTVNFEESEKIGNNIVKADAIGIGPGMGHSRQTLSILKSTLDNAECPIVIDADGINVLQNNLDLIRNSNNKIILTPHYGEMARLIDLDIEEIKENRVEVAKQFARENDVIVVLKDHRTIITDGQYVYENTTGNSAMASGGMGDVLTGIITSLIAQGYEPLKAACLGTYVHGYCGDKLAEEMFCVNATHIIDELPYGIKELF